VGPDHLVAGARRERGNIPRCAPERARMIAPASRGSSGPAARPAASEAEHMTAPVLSMPASLIRLDPQGASTHAIRPAQSE
jgi:hypothetical protein